MASGAAPATEDWRKFDGPLPFQSRPLVHFLIKHITKGLQKAMRTAMIFNSIDLYFARNPLPQPSTLQTSTRIWTNFKTDPGKNGGRGRVHVLPVAPPLNGIIKKFSFSGSKGTCNQQGAVLCIACLLSYQIHQTSRSRQFRSKVYKTDSNCARNPLCQCICTSNSPQLEQKLDTLFIGIYNRFLSP